MRVPLFVRQKVDGSPADQLRLRHLRHQLDWSPWFDQGLRPTSDRHVRTRAFIKHQLRSLSRSRRNHLWSSGAQRQHCPQATVLFFLDSELVSAATTSSSIALTIALVELCGIETITTLENFVEFRWRNLWQSTIYRSHVKSGRESGRVWSVVSSI